MDSEMDQSPRDMQRITDIYCVHKKKNKNNHKTQTDNHPFPQSSTKTT